MKFCESFRRSIVDAFPKSAFGRRTRNRRFATSVFCVSCRERDAAKGERRKLPDLRKPPILAKASGGVAVERDDGIMKRRAFGEALRDGRDKNNEKEEAERRRVAF